MFHPLNRIVAPTNARQPGVQLSVAGTTAELQLYGDFYDYYDDSGITAKAVSDKLRSIPATVNELTVRINSPGGSMWEALPIYNLLVNDPRKVTTIIDAIAASAASFVAMAGSEIHIFANASFMIHDPSNVAWGTASDFRKMADRLDGDKQAIVDIYAARTGVDAATISGWMTEETWFRGQAALDSKFATKLIPNKSADNSSTNAAPLNLRHFKNVPDWAKPSLNSALPFSRLLSLPEPTMSVAADPAANPPAASANAAPAATPPVAPAAVPPVAPATNAAPGITAPVTPNPAVNVVPTAADLATASNNAITVERTRVRDIMALCDKGGFSNNAKTYIDQGLSVADVQAQLFTAMCNQRQPLGEDGKTREGSHNGAPDADAAFKADYAKNKATYDDMGITEAQFVASQRISANLDKLKPGSVAAK